MKILGLTTIEMYKIHKMKIVNNIIYIIFEFLISLKIVSQYDVNSKFD